MKLDPTNDLKLNNILVLTRSAKKAILYPLPFKETTGFVVG